MSARGPRAVSDVAVSRRHLGEPPRSVRRQLGRNQLVRTPPFRCCTARETERLGGIDSSMCAHGSVDRPGMNHDLVRTTILTGSWSFVMLAIQDEPRGDLKGALSSHNERRAGEGRQSQAASRPTSLPAGTSKKAGLIKSLRIMQWAAEVRPPPLKVFALKLRPLLITQRDHCPRPCLSGISFGVISPSSGCEKPH